jgi:hypothetical protein
MMKEEEEREETKAGGTLYTRGTRVHDKAQNNVSADD